MSEKQAINDKLQGSVATYLRCGGIVNNQMKKSLLLSLRVWIFLIGEYLAKLQARARGCLVHFARPTNTLLTDGESARDNHVLASLCQILTDLKKISDRLSNRPFFIWLLTNPTTP